MTMGAYDFENLPEFRTLDRLHEFVQTFDCTDIKLLKMKVTLNGICNRFSDIDPRMLVLHLKELVETHKVVRTNIGEVYPLDTYFIPTSYFEKS